MKAKLIKKEKGYVVVNDVQPIASTLSPNEGSKLSLENCYSIELGYDLNNLIKEEYPVDEASFKRGFQKAIEILGDRRFSKDDLEDCWETAHQAGRFEGKNIAEENWQTIEDFIQSLQKTEWEVEIETNEFNEKKLDSNGCLILRPFKNKSNKNLTSEELYEVTEKLYKQQNPNTRCSEPPSSSYVTVIEKWYPEYQKSESNIDFFNWCLINK